MVAAVWLLCVAAAAGLTAHGQAQERASLVERFQNRADTGASFVGAYVHDVFQTEERLAARAVEPTWRPSQFASSLQFLGFPAGVLLDPQGRAVALAPAAPQLRGKQLAAQYPHLASALAGRPTVSDVVPSAVKGEPIVAFALPVTSSRFGVLSGGFSLATSPLKAFLGRQPIPGTRGWVVDSKGATIVSAGPASDAPVSRSLLTQASKDPTVAGERVTATAAIPGTGWTYVLDVPSDALLAPVAANDRNQWALLATLAALSLAGLVVTARAIAARTQAREEKAHADHRLRLTVQNAPIGMTMVDLGCRFVEPNARLCSMLGYSSEELVTMTFGEVTHADDAALDATFVAQLTSGDLDTYDVEKRFVRHDGSVLWGRLAVSVVRDSAGSALYFVYQIEDVTDFRRAQDELEYRALYDPLTGLANRSLLMDRLKAALAGGRGVLNVGVAFCDVDHFKQINDAHGHHIGDEVLKEVARRLRDAVRTGDTVARMGGDEFVILLHNVGSLTEAEMVMDRATRAAKQPLIVDDLSLGVSVSVGLAVGAAGTLPGTLLRNADAALYDAKAAGRGRYVVHGRSSRTYTTGPRRGAVGSPAAVTPPAIAPHRDEEAQTQMERLIQDALDQDRIGVAYQPVFDLATGLAVGAEALLRLTDSLGRPAAPRHVIPAAEASGQIIELGRRVMRAAGRQVAGWYDEHGILLPVAVNVSGVQLDAPTFLADVLDAVKSVNLPPRALIVELTESVLVRTDSGGMEQLHALSDAGIELAIDDFGTGYASLSLLHELPAASLKIDKSFVAGIPDDRRAVAIVAAVIALARNFNMLCIAEGIETDRQRGYLAVHGVLGQGFLLGRPGDGDVIGRIIGQHGVGASLVSV